MRIHFFSLLCLAGCQQIPCGSSQPPSLPSAPLMADVRALTSDAMAGRKPGTPGHDQARDYLVARFGALGWQVLRQPVPEGGENLIAWRGQPKVWVMAHYDHLGPGYPGADDNASGVAVLLALAEHHPGSLALIATDNEERGLYGAKALLAMPPLALPQLVINLDMVGRGPVLYAAGTRDNPALKPLVAQVAKDAPLCLRPGHDSRQSQRGSALVTDWRNASDHAPFREADIPYLYLGNDTHGDWHNRTDRAERLRPAFLAAVAQTTLTLLSQLDDKGLSKWQAEPKGGDHD